MKGYFIRLMRREGRILSNFIYFLRKDNLLLFLVLQKILVLLFSTIFQVILNFIKIIKSRSVVILFFITQ